MCISSKTFCFFLMKEMNSLLNNYKLDPYWTYELCHGFHIRQFHDTKVAGKVGLELVRRRSTKLSICFFSQKSIVQEYYLGYYHSDNQDILTDSDGKLVLKVDKKISSFENKIVSNELDSL